MDRLQINRPKNYINSAVRDVAQARVEGSTFSRVADPQVTVSPLTALVSGLSELAPELQRFAVQADARERERADEEVTSAFAGMTLEQAREKVRKGEIAQHKSPYFQAAFMARLGENEAEEAKRHLLERFATDRELQTTGDVEGWIAGEVNTIATGLPDNPFARRAFLAQMEGFNERVLSKQVEIRAEETNKARLDQVQRSLGNVLDAAIRDGVSPKDGAAALFQAVEENATTGLASRQEQQDLILRQVEGIAAQGKTELLREVLDFNRGPAGTLRSVLGANAERLIETATKVAEAEELEQDRATWEPWQMKLNIAAGRGQLTPGMLSEAKKWAMDDRVAVGKRPIAGGEYFASLVLSQDSFFERKRAEAERRAEAAARDQADARIAALTDLAFNNGRAWELPAAERNAAAERAYQQNGAMAKNMAQRHALDIQTWSRSGIASPYTKQLFSDAGSMMANGMAVDEKGQPNSLMTSALEAYRTYKKTASGALPQLLPENQRKLFETYDALSKTMSPQQALLRVQSVATGQFKPMALPKESKAAIKEAVEAKVNKLGATGAWLVRNASWLPWIKGTVAHDPRSDVRQRNAILPDEIKRDYTSAINPIVAEIEREAGDLILAGASPDKAAEAATSLVTSRYGRVGDYMVRHNGVALPSGFADNFPAAIEDVIKRDKLGKHGWNSSNVMAVADPRRAGTWHLVPKHGMGQPLAVITNDDVKAAATRLANEPGMIDRLTDFLNPRKK